MDGFQPQPDDYPHEAGDEYPDSSELGDVPDVPDVIEESDTPAEDPIDLSELPEPPQTGDVAVDKAIGNVARAMHEPLETQLAAYELAHRSLQDRLADVES